MSAAPRRREGSELATMARDVVTGHAMVANHGSALESAFSLVICLMDWTDVDMEKVGAIYGKVCNTVPGRSCNGFPIFTSATLIHVDDLGPLVDVIDRLQFLIRLGEKPKG